MLLNRPELYQDESLSSYLYRIARANYSTIGVFLSRFGITRADWLKNIFSNDQVTNLSLHLMRNKDDLLRRTYALNNNLWKDNLDTYSLRNRMKFCPECSKERVYHRMPWGLEPVSICLKHSSLLIDFCPSCRKKVIMDQFMTGGCASCGFSYLQTESISILENSIEFEMQREVQTALFQSKTILQELGGLNIIQFLILAKHSFHLLEGLPAFLDTSNKELQIFQNRIDGLYLNKSSMESYSYVFWMYKDFPHHFHFVLSEFSKKPKKKLYAQKKEFENLFNLVDLNLVRTAYEEFWVEELEKGTVRRDLSVFKQNQQLLASKNHFRKEEIKQLTGMSYPKIVSLHNSGQINIFSKENGKTNQHFIDKTSFFRLYEDRQHYINKKEAAEILGIQQGSISQLVKDEFLREVETGFSKKKLFLKKDVKRLLRESRGVYNPNVDGLKFHQVLIKYSVNRLTIVKLLNYIHQEILNPQVSINNGKLSDIWFKKDEIKRCIEILKQEKKSTEGLYMQDVMRFLRIGETKMKRLIENGQLVPVKIIIWKDGRKRYLFNIDQVVALSKNSRNS
ncbi:TniQ family protein [Paenibacillus sp. FSL R5-0876]|uniref:TniQ family protein n=1 Tax=Paenibacillus sp. FSL R5-0876 TaxID=2921661 RepID=UPI0030FA0253